MPPLRRLILAALLAPSCAVGDDSDDVPWLTAPTRASHATYFPIDEGSHEAASCDDCHGPFDTFTEFTCLDCHAHAEAPTRAAHGAVSDFRYESRSCLGCHRDGVSLSREDHDRIFPIGAGTAHASAACEACHASSSDRSNLACVGCHPHDRAPTRAAHAAVGGYVDAAEGCLKCHDRARVFSVGDHRPFRVDRRAEHRPDRAACLACHPAERTDRPYAVADFGVFDCAGCHERGRMDDEHEDTRGYAYANPRCFECHPSGEDPD